MSSLEKSLTDLLAKHSLRCIQIEVATYLDKPSVSVFWTAPAASHGCDMAYADGETFAEALTAAITKANAKRVVPAEVTLPDTALCVEA